MDYFKTFHGGQSSVSTKAGSSTNRSTMPSNSMKGFQGIGSDIGNPFSTVTNAESSGKKYQAAKSLIKPNNNPFSLNFKKFAPEKTDTRNSKLTSKMHIRAKTTSDFDSLTSNAKLKALQASLH